MRKNGDAELTAYRNLIGHEVYDKQYKALYNQSRHNKRYSELHYTNDKIKLEAIKEKYKNGVSDDIIKEMVGIK